MSAISHRRATDDPTWAKVLVIGIVMAFLALVLILPLVAVFAEALRKGLGAALEAIVRYHGGPPLRDGFHRIAERRGTNKARIATARRLMTLVYYGLRDGEIRCLQQRAVA